METVIAAAVQRLRFYQESQFACEENDIAIDALDSALAVLNERTQRREKAGTEGLHEGN